MTRIATMGTSSCATIAIAGFKGDQVTADKQYLDDPSSFQEPTEGLSVAGFYSNILYPVSQPLGHTHELPFEKLMKDLDASPMKTKFTIATLNSTQQNGEYWPERLKSWGFNLIDATDNTIGQRCYVWARNANRPEIYKEKVTPLDA